MVPFLNLGNTVNNGLFGVQNNPAGTDPVVAANAVVSIIPSGGSTGNPVGTPIFPTLSDALAGTGTINLFAVDPNFRPSVTNNFDLNVQQDLSPSVFAPVGDVGTCSRHLT